MPSLDQKSEKSFCEEDHAALVNPESEQSDDELLTLSSPHGNASGDKHHGAKKPSKKQQEPAAPPPPEDVDLLGLEGSAVSQNFSPPVAPPTNSELLSDLFGGGGAAGPAQAGQSGVEDVFHPSGPASTQSTPRRSAASTSASPTLRVGEGNVFHVVLYLSVLNGNLGGKQAVLNFPSQWDSLVSLLEVSISS